MLSENHLSGNSSNQGELSPIVLVSLPWAPPTEPSLGLAILKSSLAAAGIKSRVYHASTALLEWITYETHSLVASFWGCNEFVFTAGLDPIPDDAQLAALWTQAEVQAVGSRHLQYSSPEKICDLLLTLRDDVMPKFLSQTADRILAWEPRLVGLTCMFDQTVASVALAKVLKKRAPDIRIVLGGYGLEGAPGDIILKAFPWIDWVVRGDGEQAIVELAKLSTRESTASEIAVDSCKTCRAIRGISIPLDASPTPDYDDWFRDVETLEKDHSVAVDSKTLRVESSRGCWWGQSKHCVFCGIDDDALSYRHKSPETVLAMLQDLRSKYGTDLTFCFSDYIFPKSFYKSLLPRLAEVVPKFRLWCEIKANQTANRVKQFADAGFYGFQPGVESFCTQVLKAMDKGVRGIDNVALLKWAYENRLVIDYNFLFGFPDDEVASYEAMLRKIPLLYHLTPPVSRTEIIVTRFAPLQFAPGRFGITSRPTHHPCYDVLFSESFRKERCFDLDDYCYYFERNFSYKPRLATLYNLIVDEINHWKSQHTARPVWLSYDVPDGGTARVSDARYGEAVEVQLSPAASAVYLQCTNGPINKARLNAVATSGGCEGTADEALDELRERRLLWEEGDLVIGLATPGDLTRERTGSGWTKEWSALYV
jgi:ribosomal peptide maturation radical SAM protein 1